MIAWHLHFENVLSLARVINYNMYCGDDVSAIVGDVGTDTSKFGYAGEDMPKLVCPSAVGTLEDGSKKYIAGSSQLHARHRQPLTIHEPKKDGLIQNWDIMEKLWQHAYEELHIDSKEHPVLAADSPFMTLNHKKEYAEMFFEKFDAPCMFLSYDAVLNAFSFGRSNALVIDAGAGSTRVVPVNDGYILEQPSQKSFIGGNQLDNYMEATLLQEHPDLAICSRYKQNLDVSSRENLIPSTEHYMKQKVLQDIKESLCRMPETTLNEPLARSVAPDKYELPDGTQVEIGVERYKVPEILINPINFMTPNTSSSSLPASGLPRMIYDAVQACDPDLRRELFSNMLLCGGGSLFPGLASRLYTEVSLMVPSTFKVRFVTASNAEKRFSVFTGGSILASLGTFQQLWISKREYQDQGAERIMGERCI